MSRLAKLHQNAGHQGAENTTFILRLRFKIAQDQPSKADCINLLNQYLPLYQAMEQRLTELNTQDTPCLHLFNEQPWANRSVLLSRDIDEMMCLLSKEEQVLVLNEKPRLAALTAMIDAVLAADPITLLAYLAVRGLADAFGGQAIQRYTQQVFEPNQLTGAFYHSVAKGARVLGAAINKEALTQAQEQQFFATVDGFFQAHIALFEEMEQTRASMMAAMQPVKHTNTNTGYCRYALFGVAAVTAATALGASYLCGLTSL